MSSQSLVAGAPAVTGALVIEAVMSVLSQALPDKAIGAYSRPTSSGRQRRSTSWSSIAL